MSVDIVGNLDTPESYDEGTNGRKHKRSKAKVRKHLLTTAYKQDIAEKLDKLCAGGHTIVSITSSPDIRGFEVISYNEE